MVCARCCPSQAVVLKACKSAMTSGTANEKWTIRFNHTGVGLPFPFPPPIVSALCRGFDCVCACSFVRVTDKWGMPLMNWLSAADTLNQLPNTLAFKTKEDAVRMAERNGELVHSLCWSHRASSVDVVYCSALRLRVCVYV